MYDAWYIPSSMPVNKQIVKVTTNNCNCRHSLRNPQSGLDLRCRAGRRSGLLGIKPLYRILQCKCTIPKHSTVGPCVGNCIARPRKAHINHWIWYHLLRSFLFCSSTSVYWYSSVSVSTSFILGSSTRTLAVLLSLLSSPRITWLFSSTHLSV